MTTKQWKLIKTFTLPLDSKGRQLSRVDCDANYHNDLAELRNKYQDYQQETRGDVHTQIEFWALIPVFIELVPTQETTPEPIDLYETDSYKMDELTGAYSGVEKRFIIYHKPSESGIYDKHGFLVKLNYNDCKTMIDELQMVEDLTKK